MEEHRVGGGRRRDNVAHPGRHRQPGAPAVPFEQLRAELRLQFVNAGGDRRLRQMLVARRCTKAAQTGGPIERFDLLQGTAHDREFLSEGGLTFDYRLLLIGQKHSGQMGA
jgi:hypothetical protein